MVICRLAPLAHPLPFAETPAKLDGDLQRLLDLFPLPAPVVAPRPAPQPVQESLPIGVFLRGISFSGKPVAVTAGVAPTGSCRHFFRYQVNWHGSGSDGSVGLVQLAAWATAEAIERSRKASPLGPPSVRQFFRQIAWSGVSHS